MKITSENYPASLDRFSTLWNRVDAELELRDEFEELADLLSEYEDKAFPIMNYPTYRQMLNEKKMKLSRMKPTFKQKVLKVIFAGLMMICYPFLYLYDSVKRLRQ